MPEGTERGGRGCFFYGCLVAIGLAAVVVIAFVALWRSATVNLDPHVDRFQAAFDQGDYKSAYEMTGGQFKATMTYDQFVDFGQTVKGVLGTCESKTRTSFNFKSNFGGSSTAHAVYTGKFTKGTAEMTFSLEKQGETWIIQGAHYASDLFARALKCPHCAHVNETLGKFCSQCGKPMKREAQAPPAKAKAPPGTKQPPGAKTPPVNAPPKSPAGPM